MMGMKSEQTKFTIKQWSEDDQPREKLLRKGKHSLSDAELLAILIGSGSPKISAVDLCKQILLQNSNQLHLLQKQTVQQLKQFKGIGEAKALSIVAALELSNRIKLSENRELDKISSSSDVFSLMQPFLGELIHEEFWVLCLNASHKVLHKFRLSQGGMVGTVVDTRLLFKTALEFLSFTVILVHNHPSGELSPSQADRELTLKIKQAGEVLDIRLLDHVIISRNNFWSFADHGEI